MSWTRTTLAPTVATLGLLAVCAAGSRTQGLFQPLPTEVAAPADNPTTPEKVALGRLLFWDPILSGQMDVSCATCHHPAAGYADDLDLAIGPGGTGTGSTRTFAPGQPVRHVKRNSQTVLNTAFNGLTATSPLDPASAPMFWDTRVRSLEAQALEPIKADDEMRGGAYPEERALAEVVARLAAIPEYRTRFARAFGPNSAIAPATLGQAIAAYERTLITPNAPFDRYLRGDTSAMSADAVRGMNRFQQMGCDRCHSGPMFSDFQVHTLGVPDNAKLAAADAGAGGRFAFRTPTLRNLAVTAPYMHNGAFATLGEVVNFYDRSSRGGRGGRGGGRGPGGRGGSDNPNVARADVDPLVRQLNMRGGGRGGRQNDVLAFLDALNDPTFDRTIPERVPSGLQVGGGIAAN